MNTVELRETGGTCVEPRGVPSRGEPRRRDADISSIVGLVTGDDLKKTAAAVSVRFAESSVLNVQMNMVAFD